MKNSLLVAALVALTLTACGKKEEAPAAPAAEAKPAEVKKTEPAKTEAAKTPEPAKK